MSIQPVIYRCDKCDFSASSMVNWGNFHYLDGKKLLSLNRKLGWCDSCATLTPIEVLPSLDELAHSQQKCEKMLQEYQLAYESLMLKRTWFARLMGLKPKLPDDLMNIKMDINALDEDMSELKASLAYLSGRKSPPRCLKCGSQEVSSLSLFPAHKAVAAQIQVFKHPNCGGAVRANVTEIRFAMRLPEYFYDKEGIKVAS